MERKPEVPASPLGEALFRCARPSGVPSPHLQGILKKIGCCYHCVQTGKSRLPFLPLSAVSSAH